ncbi:hypothetical protein C8J56DRAFT_1002894 [Mycena floridula]|nr:hypothetical protein C8J56DRAFT_1002894 [Mycena floridula]
MAQRANQVVRLLEELRRMHLPEEELVKADSNHVDVADDHRPPKRPWEDMSQDEVQQFTAAIGDKSQAQTMAEQDMEIIRTKRATSTAGAVSAVGQPKSKYRKRSRATPPGKCHSCNIRETPEWRRGPDGARTLCNACGLHYAKLMRKRMQLNPGAPAPHIDMDTLRASARAADQEKNNSSNNRAKQTFVSEDVTSPMDKPAPLQQHHQGSFQVVNMTGPSPNSASPVQQMSPALSSASNPAAAPASWPSAAAPPPGNSSRSFNRKSSDQLQHQSFLRTPQNAAVTGHPSR